MSLLAAANSCRKPFHLSWFFSLRVIDVVSVMDAQL